MAQRNRAAAAAARADAAGRGTVAARAPSVRTRSRAASKVTTTVPSRSVRRTRAPAAARRSMVARVGWPYGLSAPADATATFGRTRSTKAWVVAVRLP